jgi:hypothetical protein
MVAAAALARAESRGCHRRSDAGPADAAREAGRRTALLARDGEIDVIPDITPSPDIAARPDITAGSGMLAPPRAPVPLAADATIGRVPA